MSKFFLKIKHHAFWIIPALLIVAAFAAGWIWRGRVPTGTFVKVDPALRAPGNYKYINPLLACGTWESKDFDESTVFKSQVSDYISKVTANGDASQVGVYFRELKGTRWFGINENAKFSPASLLKVPLMITYLKLSEKRPELLDKTFPYGGSFDLNAAEYFHSPFALKPGGLYTADNLLTAMIVNSDNNATKIIEDSINKASMVEVFTDLGLSVPDASVPAADFMSPKSYSYFFRVLYNATYLNEDYSERALSLLAGPDFPQGLESTVESDVVVAQKFGERSVLNSQGAVLSRELHDCGIIYYPGNPYLLCVMTKGSDFKTLLPVIQTIGKMVYADVKNEK